MAKYIIGAIVIIGILISIYWGVQQMGGIGVEETTPPPPQAPTTTTYASSTMGVSITYPKDFTVDETHAYTQVSPTKPIHGVKFTIPAAMTTGTNLAADTYLSVEQLPRAQSCTGDIYIKDNVKAQKVTEGVEYSVATTSGAAAGNLYEEHVFALTDSSPCTAVRYYIHSGNIANFPQEGESTVREFDRAALLGTFDTIRRSLQLGSAPVGTTTPVTP